MNWREYQEEVALFFRSIGANTEIEAKVKGVRGNHKVDVLVRLKYFGINVIWIVECKLWKASVSKEKVLALQQIVQDVGADRGIIMSESGFQAGAIKSALLSNITLSSIDELRYTSTEDFLNAKLKLVSSRLTHLTKRYHTFIPWSSFSIQKPVNLIDDALPDLFMIRMELSKAYSNNFPINMLKSTITNLHDFIIACEDVFRKAEIEIYKVENEYNKNIIVGRELFQQLKVEIEALLEACANIVKNKTDASIQNDIRIHAVTIMKKIGDLTLEVRAYTNNNSFHFFQHIHNILIDKLYLDLINIDLQAKDIEKTRNNFVKAYSKFEQFFQPINNPPAPETPT